MVLVLALLLACTGTTEGDDGVADGGATDDTGSTDDGGIDAEAPPVVVMETSLGSLSFTLTPDLTPVTVDNFLAYVDAGYYDGSDGLGATVIHRVDADFVFQGGIYTEDGGTKQTEAPIVLETDVGLSNLRGTLAMARTSVADSATASFFVNIVDNTHLDYADQDDPGYAVFGEVTEGMDVVDAIAAVAVDGETPVESIVILSTQRQAD